MSEEKKKNTDEQIMKEIGDISPKTSSDAETEIKEEPKQPSEELSMEKKLENLEQEKEEFKKKYFLTLADLQNMSKRFEKDKQEIFEYANTNLLREILTIMDSLKLSLKQDKNVPDDFLNGVLMIKKQLEDFLTKNNVKEICLKEKDKFNPEAAEAVAKEEIDTDEMIILEIYQTGYYIKDRILRPAMVKVGIPKQAINEEERKEEKDE